MSALREKGYDVGRDELVTGMIATEDSIMVIWNIINSLFIVIVGLAVVFYKSYMAEKGKNLATKEDIGRITSEIESVRSQFEVYVHSEKEIFSKEYSLLEKVWEYTWELQARVRNLRPMLDCLPKDLDERNKVEQQRVDDYIQSMKLFIDGVVKKRPFIPDKVYDVVMKLRNTVVTEESRVQILNAYSNVSLLEEAQSNIEKLNLLIEELNEAIRSHVSSRSKV